MFQNFSIILNDGMLPCMKMLIHWLLNEGKFCGLIVIFLPLLSRLVAIFKKFI